jgi:hypothetical protein
MSEDRSALFHTNELGIVFAELDIEGAVCFGCFQASLVPRSPMTVKPNAVSFHGMSTGDPETILVRECFQERRNALAESEAYREEELRGE